MKHLVLIGDSVFDNSVYVNKGESVLEQMIEEVGVDIKVSLLAVDGDVTTDVNAQLKELPNDSTYIFVSCGGNDALRVLSLLDKETITVRDSLELLNNVRNEFKKNYKNMLSSLLHTKVNLVICTVYNSIPDMGGIEFTGLALFNEIILEEAISKNLPIIDLRNICNEANDYSQISSIEPSAQGSKKIVKIIKHVIDNHEFNVKESRVYC